MRELQPVNQHVIIAVDQKSGEQRTSSGIIFPDTVEKDRPNSGKVIAMSNIESPEVSVGDTVIFKEYSGTNIKLDEEEFLVLPYGDILAKIVETEEI